MPRVLFNCNLLLFVILALSLTGCDLARNYTKTDRSASAEIQDFRDIMAPRLPEVDHDSKKRSGASSIPSLQSYIADPSDDLRSMPLVSISVNQSVPLRDVLYELARQADFDLELDPAISGSIIFTAREKPLDLVVKRIAEISGLRYRFEDGVMRVEVDRPYSKTYKLDYLSLARNSSGIVENNISVVSGEGADTGSSFSTATESQSDFWSELQGNLTQILGVRLSSLKTDTDPALRATAPQPEQAAGASGETYQGEGAEINVSSLPDVPLANSGGVSDGLSSSTGGAPSDAPSFSMNKQAGLISIYAPERLHKEVQEYLEIVKRSVASQVLIEAKILEVSLTDEYTVGVNWTLVDSMLGNELTLGFTGATTLASGSLVESGNGIAFGYTGNDFSSVIDAVSAFGTVRALASPRMTVLNNQAAVLNVADNVVYFELDGETETDEDTGDKTVTIESEIKSVPEGVLMNVIPSINFDNQTISMAVRPTVTRVTGFEEDPGFTLIAIGDPDSEDLRSLIPELNVQEIDTVIEVPSGGSIVMGGLLSDRSETIENAVPVLGEVPIMGNLFKGKRDNIVKTELIILLRATIVNKPSDTIHNADKDLYRRFSEDRRPMKL